MPHWFLEVERGKDGPLADVSKQEQRPLAHYDRYEELVNTWVHVTGNHMQKGLYGRIQQSLGVTTWYRLLHYDYLIRRTGLFIFLSTYLI